MNKVHQKLQYKIVKLGDIAKRINDLHPNRSEWEFSKYVTGRDFESGEIRLTKFNPIKGNENLIGYQFQWRFQPGDVLYVVKNPRLRKAAMVNFEGICSISTFVIRTDNSRFLQNLLPFLLQTEHFVSFARKNEHGSTNPFLNWKDIARYEFHLPLLEEQKKISELLWSIEGHIEKLEILIKKLKTYKNSKTNELLTRGIGHTKFKKIKSLFGKYEEIPEEWEYRKLSDLAENEKDIVAGPFGSNLVVSDYRTEGVPIIRLQNIERNKFLDKNIQFISKEKAEELKYHSYQPDDLVLAKLGDPIGKTCRIPKNFPAGIVVADVVRIRTSSKKSDSCFIEYVLNSKICERQIDKERIGTTRPRVNLEQIRNLEFPTPPIQEQQKIVSILSNIDKQIEQLENHFSKLKALRKSILNEKLTPPKLEEKPLVQ